MNGGKLQGINSEARPSGERTDLLSTGFTILDLKPSFERSLRARNLAASTVGDYLEAVDKLAAWLTGESHPVDAPMISQAHLEGYVVAGLDRGLAAATVAGEYRRLQQFFRWLHDEDEIDSNPMAKMSPPQLPVVPPRIMPDEDVAALLGAMRGKEFEDRRDTAIVRCFIESGMRLSSMAGIEVQHVNFKTDTVRLWVKGDKWIDVPFGAKTGEALDRYMRVRARHRHRVERWLWLGRKGRLRASGIYQMTVRRADQADIEHIHPHLWRSKFAHEWCLADGSESNLMRIMGWSSSDMPRRYTASAADERARKAHRTLAIGDRY